MVTPWIYDGMCLFMGRIYFLASSKKNVSPITTAKRNKNMTISQAQTNAEQHDLLQVDFEKLSHADLLQYCRRLRLRLAQMEQDHLRIVTKGTDQETEQHSTNGSSIVAELSSDASNQSEQKGQQQQQQRSQQQGCLESPKVIFFIHVFL